MQVNAVLDLADLDVLVGSDRRIYIRSARGNNECIEIRLSAVPALIEALKNAEFEAQEMVVPELE